MQSAASGRRLLILSIYACHASLAWLILSKFLVFYDKISAVSHIGVWHKFEPDRLVTSSDAPRPK
ncbi:hypothetical protein Dthio_PD3305 [Desulfonatronospira thiodismutans ASO3-1]|uniref:Uncharacterized protein n=1 Tax=Desulfonatronospira thiodismutans ASO3-1 TaxID=555779 RepID=D6SMF5_9BACT|nr:hypothetical protein Dthio_PD3305 [Desulfonatronospira thiodismutans ASO3-1]